MAGAALILSPAAAPSVAAANDLQSEVTVQSFLALRKRPPHLDSVVNCLWREKPGDGGGGRFFWDPESTDSDDGGCTIASDVTSVGRWRREVNSPLSPIWFGADPSGRGDSTLALKAVLARNEDVYIPAGNFRITDTLAIVKAGRRITGAGQGATKIVMMGRNRPIIRWWGARTALENLLLEYAIPQQIEDTESAGITVDNTGPKNTRFLQKSSIRNVSIRNSYIGILVPNGSVFFSVTVDNVEVDGYAKSAFYMAEGASGTGSAILNLYTQNRMQECLGPVVQFSAIVEGFVGQINIEHTKVRDHALCFVSSDHVSVSSVHIEDCHLLTPGKAFVAAAGSIFVSMDVLSVQFADISVKSSIFFLYGQPKLSVQSLTLRDLRGPSTLSPYTYRSPALHHGPVGELEVTSVYLARGASERLSPLVEVNQLGEENAILRQWGRDVYFRQLNGYREYFGSSAPPSAGRFNVGDRVYNAKPQIGEPVWWICLTGGSPGTWQAGPRL
ncbi:hypothetical protein E4K66_24105 [Bradyrhizobium frederickii]|uniref:Uncharacterized protein n=1 Tax=Bradyrhizobium frederickii TaxID=2560054 RepID=A0A4Y9KYH3_9BRAD|nr:glycosyl hydrolase family 28-related protein [Bradyrhizobium frederickii]TFV36381.1 hypothetical protein E4K66_24105 [Bradyrhizobium frederickii]